MQNKKRGNIKIQLFASNTPKFSTVGEAFNHYRNSTIDEIEKRTTEIKGIINTDGTADVTMLNIEVEGLKQAKENIEEKEKESRAYKFIEGTQTTTKPITDIFESEEYRSAFLKNMLGQPLTDIETRSYNQAIDKMKMERRLDAFNTTTNSGAVLPTTTLNEVVKKARNVGGLISHVREFNIPTNLSIPIGTPSSKAKWHNEGEKVDSDKTEVVSIEFGSHEILKVFSISVSAKRMSIQAFESYLIEELTATVIECIADSLVNGTGIKQGEGVLNGITWNAENSIEFAKAGSVKYTDITKMLAKLKRGYGANAKFVMNNSTLYNQIYGLVDGNGRPLFISDVQGESIGRILGKEVVVDDYLEDDVILLGDLSYLGFNLPQGIALECSRESSFKYGLVDYRAMAIADSKVLVPEAFLKLSRATA